ncbi:hypothetical protein [Shewanella surugensis]|uniref:CopG family transcriptional regulator n=1 Tax=Shewanella surugensis TaxID=212020 RepID=A0ABT0L986_9GAMM|nr:hypothetical protein [Shewanella surugensis]MCL1124119.1 hypothetical protein [Shewanella surugensis]
MTAYAEELIEYVIANSDKINREQAIAWLDVNASACWQMKSADKEDE